MTPRQRALREALIALVGMEHQCSTSALSVVDGLLWNVPSGERWAAWVTIRESRQALVDYRRRTRNTARSVEHDDLLVHQYEAALDHAVGLICPAGTR